MNDWMRSVADIPPGDDEDDDLAGISPELVLVDPDLARLVRERGPQPAAWEAETARRGLRLVPVRRVEDGAAPIVPRPVSTSSTGESPSPEGPGAPPASSDAPHASAPQPFETPRIPGTSAALTTPVEVVAAVEAPAVSPPPMRAVEAPAGAVVDYAPPASEREAREPDVEAPPASEPVAPEPRVVDAELARALAPEPPRGEIPPPLADPVRAAAVAERHAPPPLAQAVMPHPLARPAGMRPRTARGTGRSRRRWPAFLAVAVASAAVFGTYQVLGGSQDPAGKPRGTAAVGVPPHANATSGSKSTPKPKQATTSRPKPTPKKVAATTATPKPAGTPKKTTSKQPVETPKPAGTPKKTTSKQPVETPKPAGTPKKTTSKQPVRNAKPATKPKTSAKASPKTAGPATAPTATRRFAWAPVDGATGYHVELFRGADRVLAQDTKEPVLELGSTWRYQGREMHLTPGTYRWYVWPITQDGLASQAIVQARLPVS